jgi:replicative DNA helicase
VLRRCGIDKGDLLALPVSADERPLLYVAADRPRQIARSFKRMVGEKDRATLSQRIIFWPGPLEFDLAREPERLADLAAGVGAGTVVLDSLTDVVMEVSRDDVGSAVKRAMAHTVAAGIELLVLHHQRKATSENRKPSALADVYGSAWLTAGAGSVLSLWGNAGDPAVEVTHIKQPAAEVGPWQVIHDHEHGASRLYEAASLAALLAQHVGEGLAVRAAASALYGTSKPSRAEKAKAQRKLDAAVKAGTATRLTGADGELRYNPSAPRLRAAA